MGRWVSLIAPGCRSLPLIGYDCLERDDGQERWFTPLHNAVANGASQLVDVLLSFKPSAIALTTGEGQSPLHVAALCQDTELRRQTVEVLLGPRHVWQVRSPLIDLD